jgi:hypothetical protein
MEMPRPQETTVMTRVFAGKAEAASQDAGDFLNHVAPDGWREVSRYYAPGSWSGGAFLVALLLCLLLVGILVFIYMVLVKPDGKLVVTYQRA